MARAGDKGVGRVSVFEPIESARRRTRDAVKQLGYVLSEDTTEQDIEDHSLADEPPDIIVVALPEGEKLVTAVRAAPRPPVVVASLTGPPKNAHERFRKLDADLYTVRPNSADSMGPILLAASALATSNRRMQALRSADDRMRERLGSVGHSVVEGFFNFEFFKRMLILEIKRAKRYGYGIAVCVVAQDQSKEPRPAHVQKALTAKLGAVVIASIRDIDMPVDYASEHMLLFLPYTDTQGALEVGERVVSAVRRQVQGEDGERLTVSIGIAALREEKEVSFARLIRDANTALKAAQLKGGDRVVCRE